MGAKKAPKRGKRTPLGDRKQFLTMMHPDVIRDIKEAAIEEHRAAWDVMEEAARLWLQRRKKGGQRRSGVLRQTEIDDAS
jgi:hypothetical protein